MPRASRVVLPNYPHHIIQRGHNKQVVFASDEDYVYYLENLREWKKALGCHIYAYCLMTNHVHLIVNPGRDAENLALLMKRVSGRQTRYVNKIEGRSGTLWEGRYKSSPIKADEYLLACCRYIELNPVRAGVVEDSIKYKWSSYRYKAGNEQLDWLDFDPCYIRLGATDRVRREKYIRMSKQVHSRRRVGNVATGDTAWTANQLTGGDKFVEAIAKKIGRRIEFRGQGRPKK